MSDRESGVGEVDFALRVAPRVEVAAGAVPVTLCIRPHSVRIAEAGDGTVGYLGNGHNRLAGTVLRQTYLGDTRDYLIDLGATQVRVSAPPSEDRTVAARCTSTFRSRLAASSGRLTAPRL